MRHKVEGTEGGGASVGARSAPPPFFVFYAAACARLTPPPGHDQHGVVGRGGRPWAAGAGGGVADSMLPPPKLAKTWLRLRFRFWLRLRLRTAPSLGQAVVCFGFFTNLGGGHSFTILLAILLCATTTRHPCALGALPPHLSSRSRGWAPG